MMAVQDKQTTDKTMRRSRIVDAASRLPHRLLALLGCGLALLSLFSGDCRAQTSKSIKLNRIFVPAGKPETWPDGDWVPVSSDRLDDLLANQSRPAPRIVQIDRAEYRAELSPQKLALVNGVGQLQFSSQVPTDRFVSISPCNVTWSAARWADPNADRPVMGFDDASQLMVAVPAPSSELQMEWQLAGNRRLSGVEFDLRVPRASSSQLTVLAPMGWTLSSNTGIVTKGAVVNGAASWIVAFGQQTSVRLMAVFDDEKSLIGKGNPSLVYQQSLLWTLSRGRLDGNLDLTIDPQSNANAPVLVTVPSEVRVDALLISGRAASATEFTESVAGSQRILNIKLPSPMGASPLPVAIRFSQVLPAVVEASVAIPTVSNPQSILLDGRVEVRVASSLSLINHESSGLRQVDVRFEEGTQRLIFEQERKAVSLALRWDEREKTQRLAARQFVLIDLENAPAKFHADLVIASQSGGAFQLRAIVPRVWEVSEVFQTGSITRRVEWTIENLDAEQHRLLMTFPDGLPENSPLTLRIQGQYAGVAQTNELAVPVALLEPATPTEVIVSVISPPNGPSFGLVNGRFQPNRDHLLPEQRRWTQLAALSEDAKSRVWTAHVWTQPSDVRDARIRAQAAAAEPTAAKPETIKPVPTNPAAKVEKAVDPAVVSPIFDARLRSDVSPSAGGKDHHRLSLRLKYATQDGLLKFSLPTLAQLQHVEWNGQRVAATTDSKVYSVPMTSPDVGDEVTIHYLLPSERIFLRETYRAELPSIKAPVLGVAWEVRLPSRFSIVNFGSEFTTSTSRESENWLRWLFGPMARSNDEYFFNPFSAESWVPVIREYDGQADESESATGWSFFHGEASTMPTSLTFEVCDRLRLTAFSWLILVGTMCIGVALRVLQVQRRTSIAAVWLAMCVSATVLIPDAYAELIGGTIVACIIVCLVPRRFVRREVVPAASSADRWMASTVTIRKLPMAVLLAALLSNTSHSQDPTAPLESIDVLIEFEGDVFKAPLKTGLMFVPAKQLEQLVKNFTPTVAPRVSPMTWSGELTGSLKDDLLSGEAKFEVWVPRADDPSRSTADNSFTVPIPARFISNRDACLVEGVAAVVVPTADGSGIQLTIPALSDPTSNATPPPLAEDRARPLVLRWRKMTVAVPLRIPLVRVGDTPLWNCPLPRCTRWKLNLSVSEAIAPGLLINGPWLPNAEEEATGGTKDPTARLELKGNFGPAGSLKLETVNDTAPRGASYKVNLRSFCELHEASRRHLSFARYAVPRGEVDIVTWRLPAGAVVQLDRIQAPRLAATQVRADSTGTYLSLEFSPPHNTDFDVLIPWLVASELSGPRTAERSSERYNITWEAPVAPQSPERLVVVTHHLAGISPGPGWSLNSDQPTTSTAEAEEEFLAGWTAPNPPRRPAAVVDLKTTVPTSYGLVAQSTQRSIIWQSQIEIDRDQVEWSIEGDLDITGAPTFQHDLQLDPTLPIESVSVMEDDVERLSHWSRRGDRLTLHLRDRSSGRQLIRITAREPFISGQPLRWPIVELPSARLQERTLDVIHSRTVEVQVTGLERIATPTTASSLSDTDQLRAGFFRFPEAAEPKVIATPARLEASSWCVGSIAVDETKAAAVLNFVFEPGVAETTVLRLTDWPVALDEEPSVESEQAIVLTRVEGDAHAWSVRFEKPIARQFAARIVVPLVELEKMDDDMKARSLSAPALDGVAHQVTAWLQTITAAAEIPDVPVSDAIDAELRQRNLVSTESLSDVVVNWVATALPMTHPTEVPASGLALPVMVSHELRMGHRDETIGMTTIMFPSSATVSLELSQSLKITGLAINNRSISDDDQWSLNEPLPIDRRSPVTVAHVVWQYVDGTEPLRISRREVQLPQIRTDRETVLRFAVSGSRSREILLDIPPANDATRLAWQNALQRWQSDPTRQRIRDATALDFLLDQLKETTPRHSSDTQQIAVLPDQAVRFWVVDRRASLILLTALIALITLPTFATLVKLQTGDRLAQWPLGSGLVLAATWWICLRWGPVGFAAFVVMLIITSLQLLKLLTQPDLKSAPAS